MVLEKNFKENSEGLISRMNEEFPLYPTMLCAMSFFKHGPVVLKKILFIRNFGEFLLLSHLKLKKGVLLQESLSPLVLYLCQVS